MDEIRPPEDLSVSAEEYALRNIIPGWEPVRPLTEDEMVRPWSYHRFVAGGYPSSGLSLTIPVLPAKWINDWPTPPPNEPTGVPWGWWWAPVDSARRGAWIVVTKGRLRSHFYTLVTDPLDYVDYGDMDEVGPITALYAALRDREVKKRGVEPALLDREVKIVDAGGHIPSEARDAIDRARLMWREDRFEEVIELMERLLDEGAGTGREQALMQIMIADSYNSMGELDQALSALRAARPRLQDEGMTRLLPDLDDKIGRLEKVGSLAPTQRLVFRGVMNARSGNDPAARKWLEEALPKVDEDADPNLAYDARAALAPIYERLGEHDKALSTARDALTSAVELEFEAEAAEMRALITRLEAVGGQ